MKADLDHKTGEHPEKKGLALIMGITTPDAPAGVKNDIDNMAKTLESLDILIWRAENACLYGITAMLKVMSEYNFPSAYKFIIFYFSGHGGSVDGHPFIFTQDNEDDDNKLFVKEGIIDHLLPRNTPKIDKSVHRIFLFDCCLVDNTIKKHGQVTRQEDFSIPPQGNVLVAFATSLTAVARADPNKGGVWTRFLTKNIEEVDLPLTVVLDLTWEDTVLHFNDVFKQQIRQGKMDPQGPHYTSSSGLIWLKRAHSYIFLL